MSEEVEFPLAWAILMVVTGILLVGFVWMILNVFVGVIETEAATMPSYSEDYVAYSMSWQLAFWGFVPAIALGSLVAWGILRAVIERGGP